MSYIDISKVWMCMWLLGILYVAEGKHLLDARSLAREFETLGQEAVGVQEIQRLFDAATFNATEINAAEGKRLVKKLAEDLSVRFKEKFFAAVRNLKSVVEANYKSFENTVEYPECCKIDDSKLENDPKLGRRVDLNSICYRISPDSPSSATIPAADVIKDVMIKNHADYDTLKWQYFSTEEGVHVTYPARTNADCDDYDPRFRPWYVETATPIAKDLVLVIDSSGSMQGETMNIAREAAKTVVETLNPNDRIGIVRFSNEASTPPGDISTCYRAELAFATPDNQNYLMSYLNRMEANGQTNYLAAIQTAFDLVLNTKSSQDEQPRRKALLFLTDGKPTLPLGDEEERHQKILTTLASLNVNVSNSVTILTYGLGPDVDGPVESLLRNMSNQVGPDATRGVFTAVSTADKLRLQLGKYYNHFSTSAEISTPIVTVPYNDFSNLGIITSICLPVYYPERTLKGVACADARMSDIIADISFYQQGEYSYTFVIDKTGRTLIHPFLPSPLSDDPVFLQIASLEKSPQVNEVIQSMKSGKSGSKTFETTVVVSRGEVTKEGINTIKLQATYYWHPVNDTDFSVCIVKTEKDRQLTIRSKQKKGQNFLFYRFDLKPPPESCSMFSKIVATTELSSVKFTGHAFQDPDRYLTSTWTQDNVDHMTSFMLNEGFHLKWFKEGVKDVVIITEQMETFWKQQNEKYDKHIVWRYLGTYNGIARTYPGKATPDNYDHMVRPWYDAAKANKDQLVVTPPYEDGWGAGIVLSLVHTILEGKQSHSIEDMTIGVIAADVKLEYVHGVLIQIFPECNRPEEYKCFLVDNSGYLVYHTDFMDPLNDDVESIHLMELEPDIATYLIEMGIMIRSHCLDLLEKDNHYTWKLEMDYGSLDHMDAPIGFQLQKVVDTNIYIGIKKTTESFANSCRCQRTESTCHRTDSKACECPCASPSPFDYCQNAFPLTDDGFPTCPASKPPIGPTSSIPDEADWAKRLQPCSSVNCARFNQSGCLLSAWCKWCQTDIEQDFMCRKSELCGLYNLVTTEIQDIEPTDNPTDNTNTIYIIAGTLASVVGITIIITGVVCWCRRTKNESAHVSVDGITSSGMQTPRSGSEMLEATSTPSPSNLIDISDYDMPVAQTRPVTETLPGNIAPPPPNLRPQNNPVHDWDCYITTGQTQLPRE